MMTRAADVQFNLVSGFCRASSTSAVLSVENETLIPLELQPQTKQKLPNEKYRLSESPFLELQEVTTQTNGPFCGISIDQITTVPAANPQPYRRKRRLVTHSEVIVDRTAYQDVGSQSLVHNAEVRTDNGKKSLSGDGSFPDDILFIKVPYLRGSKSEAGEAEPGTVAGYGSKRDLNRVAYHFILKALYIQGEHKWKHEIWLTELRGALGISNDDHSKELKCLASGENVSAT